MILGGGKDVNLNAVPGLLDLHIDVILEVVHQPGSSVVLPVLLESAGVDLRRNVGELKVEVDVAGLAQLTRFLKQAALVDSQVTRGLSFMNYCFSQ